MSYRVLPGFRITLTFTVVYVSLMIIIPLGFCFYSASRLSWEELRVAAWSPRARAAYTLTLWAAFRAGLFSALLGTVVAWVLTRYDFPLKKLFDACIDLPFALPTAVAGLIFSSLLSPTGWYGQLLAQFGIHWAHSDQAIVMMMTFIGFPFVVRTVQPVLQSFDQETEEASQLLGANRWQTFRFIIFPTLLPSIVTGFALALARALGEYGSIVFVSANIPGKSEIVSVLIVERLESFQLAEATAIATVMLLVAFSILIFINLLERWFRRWDLT